MTSSDNIELAFKYHFPKLTSQLRGDNCLEAYIGEYNLLTFSRVTEYSLSNLPIGTYCSYYNLPYDDSIPLHQSTDLNELMQVTKQKLNDMFADWTAKVN